MVAAASAHSSPVPAQLAGKMSQPGKASAALRDVTRWEKGCVSKGVRNGQAKTHNADNVPLFIQGGTTTIALFNVAPDLNDRRSLISRFHRTHKDFIH